MANNDNDDTNNTNSMLPSVTGGSTREINILLINPNSTASMTDNCLRSVAPRLPAGVTVHGFTAPRPAPSAIEGQVDGVLSTAACLRALLPVLGRYDAFLVACFSAHPLVPALKEEVTHQPVMGIMEAALYAARICGDRLGVLTTGARSAVLHDDAIAGHYGLSRFSVGCEAADVAVLELDSLPADRVEARLAAVARHLVDDKGADCVCLGCAGMTEMHRACADAVQMYRQRKAMVVDGVGVGVHFLTALVREGLGTAKGGAYRSAAAGRAARKQDWY
jgi:Asp/Glu/hydantoin racemase